MSASDQTTRRSDEIRQRRLANSHAGLASSAGKETPQPTAKDAPLLERLLGKRRPTYAGARTRRPAGLSDHTTKASARVTSRRRLNLEAGAGLIGASAASTARKERRQRPSFLERLFGQRVDRRSARSTAVRTTIRTGQAAPPPVLRRERLVDRSVTPVSRSTRTRRVYDVPLNAQGAEMRLPAMPRLRVSWRVASLFLLALVGFALYYIWTAPEFHLETAQINGLKRLPAGLVNKELALTGKPVFTLDAAEVQQEMLSTFPEFSSAGVQIELPNTVMITVTERVPVMIWKQDDREHLVDAEGYTFPARQELPAGTLPMVAASGDPAPFIAGVAAPDAAKLDGAGAAAAEAASTTFEAVKQVLPESLRRTLPNENKATPLLSPQVVAAVLQMSEMAPAGSQIVYDRQHGFGWQDRRGWMVYFGNFEDMDLKLHMYRAILDTLKASGVRPELINVEYAYAPFYRVQEQQQQ